MASEYLKWKYRDVQPDVPRELTPKERWANWWDYHIWHVLAAVALLLILGNLAVSAWKNQGNAPDYQVAYIAENPLPEDAAAALEASLSALAGGGKVRLNQYLTTQTGESSLYAAAGNIQLMADLETCESFLFILEDSETFQTNYQILCNLDGSLPEDGTNGPFSIRWSDCPVLTALEMGEYSETVMGQEITGDIQALFAELSLARRGFWNGKTCKNPEGCESLWEALTEGAAS